MIDKLLRLTRPLFVFDCETTGVNTDTDRIVEIGFQLYKPDAEMVEWRSLVNPGIPIPAEVTAVHHIDDARMRRCRRCDQEKEGHESVALSDDMRPHTTVPMLCEAFAPVPAFNQLAPLLARRFTNCDFAGKNIRFDLRITSSEMQRAGVEWNYVGARIIDAERLEQLAVPRTLSHLHEKYTGAKHDGAHGALSDVRASTTVIVRQLQEHQFLPRDLDQLHELQWPGWIDEQGKFRFVNGVPCFSHWGKYTGMPMRSADVGYWDYIISKDFPPDVKELARQAKLGKFPEVKR